MEPVLLAAFRSGDRTALARVYLEHVAHVENFLRNGLRRSGRFLHADLADLVQEVFLRAFSKEVRRRYDGQRAYRPFVIAIAHHVLVDWLRRMGRAPVPVSDHVEALTEERGPLETEQGAFSADLLAVTARYIQDLPLELRLIHQHRFVAAEPQKQVATALGISRQRLRTLEKRLLKGLRLAIQGARLRAGRVVPGAFEPLRLGDEPRGGIT
jgi:RNA polymerase sigma factor (sigma-70 family)